MTNSKEFVGNTNITRQQFNISNMKTKVEFDLEDTLSNLNNTQGSRAGKVVQKMKSNNYVVREKFDITSAAKYKEKLLGAFQRSTNNSQLNYYSPMEEAGSKSMLLQLLLRKNLTSQYETPPAETQEIL